MRPQPRSQASSTAPAHFQDCPLPRDTRQKWSSIPGGLPPDGRRKREEAAGKQSWVDRVKLIQVVGLLTAQKEPLYRFVQLGEPIQPLFELAGILRAHPAIDVEHATGLLALSRTYDRTVGDL